MTSSAGSGGVVGECAWGSAESVVEADGGGECEEAGADAGVEAAEGAGAVAFEAEQVFAGLEDRLDSLPDRGEVGAAAGFVFAAWPDDCGCELGGGVFELAAGVALVADDGEGAAALTAGEQGETDLTLGRFRRGERQRPWGAVEREQ